MCSTLSNSRFEAGTTHYLAVATYYGKRIHAIAGHVEGSGLLGPLCGVDSLRCTRAHGSKVSCPACLKLIKQHQLTELLAPWPRCPRCWGHQWRCMTTPIEQSHAWNRPLACVCSLCAGTGINPHPAQPSPPLPVVQSGVSVSKGGLGYAQCSGCHNHRPISHFAAWEEGAYCYACYSRCQKANKHYAPGQMPMWAARNLADIKLRHPSPSLH